RQLPRARREPTWDRRRRHHEHDAQPRDRAPRSLRDEPRPRAPLSRRHGPLRAGAPHLRQADPRARPDPALHRRLVRKDRSDEGATNDAGPSDASQDAFDAKLAQEAYIKYSPSTQGGNGFGLAVALSHDGSTLGVGGFYGGYLFTRSGTTWMQEAKMPGIHAA